MVVIPAGSFEMGSNEGRSNERPVHQVTVARVAMGKYPVTFEEYGYFLKEHDYFAHAMGRGLSDGMGWGGRSPPCDQRQLERCRDVR
jgi:formylglycine-generating enzyme required for sulfatase activity